MTNTPGEYVSPRASAKKTLTKLQDVPVSTRVGDDGIPRQHGNKEDNKKYLDNALLPEAVVKMLKVGPALFVSCSGRGGPGFPLSG